MVRTSHSPCARAARLSEHTAERMAAFGMGAEDLDRDGMVTLYHGGRDLPSRLRPDEIFFMTPSLEVAEDYARMRKGQVFTLRVDPEVVSWNSGSLEVEFDRGGLIRDGVIEADPEPIQFQPRPDATPLKILGVGVGDRLPRTGWVVEDLVTTPEHQFLLQGQWHAAHSVLAYEFPDGVPVDMEGACTADGLRAAAREDVVLKDHYLAINLSKASRKNLLAAFPPKFKRVACHHITLAFEPTEGQCESLKAAYEGARLRVVGYARDESLECLVVEVDGKRERPDGEIFHVTLSLQPPRQARESKALLRSGVGILPVDLPIEGLVTLNKA